MSGRTLFVTRMRVPQKVNEYDLEGHPFFFGTDSVGMIRMTGP